MILEQTEGTGVNAYTHGEMFQLTVVQSSKKYPQLKGNFGTVWQNQQKEFTTPVLSFSPINPPHATVLAASDRVYTTEFVAFPELVHIGRGCKRQEGLQRCYQAGLGAWRIC